MEAGRERQIESKKRDTHSKTDEADTHPPTEKQGRPGTVPPSPACCSLRDPCAGIH